MKPAYKILVFAIPLSGHINPLLPILKEIIEQNKNVKIIVYTSESFKNSIESIGAEYRFANLSGSISVLNNLKPFTNKREFQLFNLMTKFLGLPEYLENVKITANEISQEEPDLVMYDILNPIMKWSAKYYNKCYKLGQTKDKSKLKFCPKKPLPASIAYSTSLASCDGIYPNDFEKSQVCSLSLRFFWDMFVLFVTSLIFSFKVSVEFTNPFKQIHDTIPNTKMVFCTVSPDIVISFNLFLKHGVLKIN